MILGIIHLNWFCLDLVAECEIRGQQRNFFPAYLMIVPPKRFLCDEEQTQFLGSE